MGFGDKIIQWSFWDKLWLLFSTGFGTNYSFNSECGERERQRERL